MIVGSYCLHLYCDSESHPKTYFNTPDEFDGASERGAFRTAQEHGWLIIKRKDKAYCPQCPESIESRKRKAKRCKN